MKPIKAIKRELVEKILKKTEYVRELEEENKSLKNQIIVNEVQYFNVLHEETLKKIHYKELLVAMITKSHMAFLKHDYTCFTIEKQELKDAAGYDIIEKSNFPMSSITVYAKKKG